MSSGINSAGIAYDAGSDALYVSDPCNGRIRRLDGGAVSTVVMGPGSLPLLAAGRASPLDWAREHGCQALIHWEGARPNRAAAKDGTREIIFRSQHTSFSLSPADPKCSCNA
jgi:hypothetical protein